MKTYISAGDRWLLFSFLLFDQQLKIIFDNLETFLLVCPNLNELINRLSYNIYTYQQEKVIDTM